MDTKKLRQKILDLAIRGKLVPQDPNDEPASVLLERISAEKEQLIKEGHEFKSETDTEVIPHLIEKYMNEGNNLLLSTQKAIKQLEGSYALAVISTEEPDKIIGARNESPLIVGVTENGNYLASDVPAILSETKEVIYLDDKEIIQLEKNKVTIIENANILEKNYIGR